MWQHEVGTRVTNQTGTFSPVVHTPPHLTCHGARSGGSHCPAPPSAVGYREHQVKTLPSLLSLTSYLVDMTLMQVRSFFLSISFTMLLALLESWETNPPYWTVVWSSRVVWSGIPSLVMTATPVTPGLPCRNSWSSLDLTFSSPGSSGGSAGPLLPSPPTDWLTSSIVLLSQQSRHLSIDYQYQTPPSSGSDDTWPRDEFLLLCPGQESADTSGHHILPLDHITHLQTVDSSSVSTSDQTHSDYCQVWISWWEDFSLWMDNWLPWDYYDYHLSLFLWFPHF